MGPRDEMTRPACVAIALKYGVEKTATSRQNWEYEEESAMVKPLSEQLSELSVHAKKAEDDVAAAKSETHDKICGAPGAVARRDDASG